MEAPKCPRCNERHWSAQPCKMTVKSEKVSFKKVVKETPKLAKELAKLAKDIKFDRNAYQREYMRRKRAERKAK